MQTYLVIEGRERETAPLKEAGEVELSLQQAQLTSCELCVDTHSASALVSVALWGQSFRVRCGEVTGS